MASKARPIEEFTLETRRLDPKLAWRISIDEEETISFAEKWEAFVDCQGIEQIAEVIIGPWDAEVWDGVEAKYAIAPIVELAEFLPNVQTLFLGDIDDEVSPISRIIQGDVGKLLNAFPKLTQLRVRGDASLALDACEGHERLESLIIETAGLPSSVVAHLIDMNLPSLTHLTLWLGTEAWGFDGGVTAYLPLLHETPFSTLRHLGLQNSEIADELAAALQDAMVLDQLDSLDLSMGTLSDVGLRHLVDNEKISNLKKLNLSQSYVQDQDLLGRLRAMGIEVDASDQKEDDGDDPRYVEVEE